MRRSKPHGWNPFFGSLNAHQWLLYIPLHHLRHNQQIAEVKTSAAYPRVLSSRHDPMTRD